MQTKPIDALRLWWRDINFSAGQRRTLLAVAAFSVAISGILILHPFNFSHTSQPNKSLNASNTVPTILAPPMLIIDVAGEVQKPGVYELPINSRVADAIKAAGGAKNSADLSYLNRARVIKDGEQIYVDKKSSVTSIKRSSAATSNGILNINRATAKELEQLPGIGPVLASRIFEYRKVNGLFASIDDLKKVQGIGASTLEKFRTKIRV